MLTRCLHPRLLKASLSEHTRNFGAAMEHLKHSKTVPRGDDIDRLLDEVDQNGASSAQTLATVEQFRLAS